MSKRQGRGSEYYQRIAEAIDYIQKHVQHQPSLDEIAGAVHMSPFHFQRMFTEWVGTSPKKFLQFVTIGHAKQLLRGTDTSLFNAALETGLSGPGRLHDLFITIEGMTPAEFKNGGAGLSINYSFAESPFGDILVASTPRGICHLSFIRDETSGLAYLRDQFPSARFTRRLDRMQQNALFIFTQDWRRLDEIKLHLRGTDFQLKVWETLLKIPSGGVSTYGEIAKAVHKPTAARAVGSAVGDNPVAVLIPCHRVIRSSGAIGDYHWGAVRKVAMLGWEHARLERKSA